MSTEPRTPGPTGVLLFLERLTAGVLLVVLAVLAWVTLMAYAPDQSRLGSVELEAVVLLVLLSAALLLVSVVALLNTR